MQKKLIALAVAAAFSAPAFADVTPYGIVDAAIASASASGQKSDLVAISGGASTSRIGIKATEDLGNGLTGVAVLEYGLDTETNQQSTTTPTISGATPAVAGTPVTSSSVTASNLAARQQMVGIAGGFGTVATGYLQTTGYDWEGKYDVLAGSSASPLQTMNRSNFLIGSVAVAARAQRAIAYISPDFGGFKFALNYSTGLAGLGNLTLADSATSLKTSAYLASVGFDHGPLSIGAVYASTVNSSTPTPTGASLILNSKEYALGGSYDFGVAKLLATYQVNTTVTLDPQKAYSVTGVVPVAGDAVAFSYAANNMMAAANGDSKSATGYTLGYLHTMSKTTTAYVAYSAVKNGAGTSAYSVDNNALAASAAPGWTSGGGSSSIIAVGLRKKF